MGGKIFLVLIAPRLDVFMVKSAPSVSCRMTLLGRIICR
jgi:hypothetical protein